MQVSWLTAMQLKYGDVQPNCAFDTKLNGWVAFVDFYKDGKIHISPFISDGDTCETKEKAFEKAKQFIQEGKEANI